MPHNCLEQYFKAQVRRLVREKRSGPSINFPESNFLKKYFMSASTTPNAFAGLWTSLPTPLTEWMSVIFSQV